MTHPVRFTAPCPTPECNGSPADWTATPVPGLKEEGGLWTVVPSYRIRCKKCNDGGSK